MKFILFIIFYTSGISPNLDVKQIEFPTSKSCVREMKKINNNRFQAYAYCVNKGE